MLQPAVATDGDGFADVIVGAPYYSNGEYQEGVALVFYGSGLGITGSNPAAAHALLEGDQTGGADQTTGQS